MKELQRTDSGISGDGCCRLSCQEEKKKIKEKVNRYSRRGHVAWFDVQEDRVRWRPKNCCGSPKRYVTGLVAGHSLKLVYVS